MLTTREGCQVAQDASDLEIIERRLRGTKELVYDAETDGLDSYTNSIVGHVLTLGPAPIDTYYIPVRHAGGGNILPVAQFELMLYHQGQRRDLHWIGHNLLFDCGFLNRHGVRLLGSLEDTQVNQALINEFSSSFSLDASCRAMQAIEKKGEDLYKHLAGLFGGDPASSSTMEHFHKLSGTDPVGTDYATGDGVATWDLRQKQIQRIHQEDLTYIYHLEQRVTRTVYRMQLRGIRIDRNELTKVEEFAASKVEEGRQNFPPGFSVRSGKDVRKWVEDQGYHDAPYTPKGLKLVAEGKLEEANKFRSYDEAYLRTIPPGQIILDTRKYSNLGASFINPLRDRHLRSDGRVHPTFHQMANDQFGTVTGRFSCSNPNLQQVPKRNMELGLPFRKVFVPDEGSEWLTTDLAQCEPRIMSHYSGAKTLIDGYLANPPVDAHSSVTLAANLVGTLGIPFKEAREYGKRINQTLLTGGGKAKIISMMGDRGAEIYDQYFQASPEIGTLLKQAADRLRYRGYIVSYLGRRARLEARNRSYVATNRLMQCANADIIKQSLVDMDDFYESETRDQVYIMNTVHDSVDVNVPEGMRDVALKGLRYLCQYGPGRRFYLRVPMAAEYAIGPSWGEATYLVKQTLIGHIVNDPTLLCNDPVKPTPEAILATLKEEALA